MRVRHKSAGYLGYSSELNPHGIGEIIVHYDDGSASSEYTRDYEVQLRNGEWVGFNDPRITTDDYDRYFHEVDTGYTPPEDE